MAKNVRPIHPSLPAELKSGYRSFRSGRFPQEWRLYQRLATGQHPNTLVIGCSDSRAAPEVIFDAAPGDLFTIRNIAALVPEHTKGMPPKKPPPLESLGTSAALEYAVRTLKVAHIVVLGHSGCGGIRACAESHQPMVSACNPPVKRPASSYDYVGDWVSLIDPVLKGMKKTPPTNPAAFADFCEDLCKETIKAMLSVVRDYPWVEARECLGELSLHGAYFCIEEGQLYALDQAKKVFQPV